MRNAFKSLAALAVVLAVVVVARAEEDKKPAKAVTLKGELGCAKCVFVSRAATRMAPSRCTRASCRYFCSKASRAPGWRSVRRFCADAGP